MAFGTEPLSQNAAMECGSLVSPGRAAQNWSPGFLVQTRGLMLGWEEGLRMRHWEGRRGGRRRLLVQAAVVQAAVVSAADAV